MVSCDDTNEVLNSKADLWINEKTRDYVVAWTFKQHYLFSYKKEDVSWCNLNLNKTNLGFWDVAPHLDFKKNLNDGITIGVLDMACEKKVITENPYRNHPFDFVEKEWEYIWKRKIVVRKLGEVLIILSVKEAMYEENRLLFYIFKMNLKSFKWERVYSIGDEMLVFGHGITVGLALKDLGNGIKSDSICFVDDDVWPDHQDHEHRTSNCGVFDIATMFVPVLAPYHKPDPNRYPFI
ncbi:putative F-box protein [Cardamine amara subsp. amara]|uniref:F-box protein n=1 Tax=Cardamine amara subsp. amara TaxID=228776 RepID=A0ABD1ASI7_CARAN